MVERPATRLAFCRSGPVLMQLEAGREGGARADSGQPDRRSFVSQELVTLPACLARIVTYQNYFGNKESKVNKLDFGVVAKFENLQENVILNIEALQ